MYQSAQEAPLYLLQTLPEPVINSPPKLRLKTAQNQTLKRTIQ